MKIVFVVLGSMVLIALNAAAQWSPPNSDGQISYMGGKVGILTTNPLDWLHVNGNIRIGGDQMRITNALTFREVGTNTRTVVRVMPSGSISALPSSLEFFGTDYVADTANYERLSLRARGSADPDVAYVILTDAGGSGTVRPVRLTTAVQNGAGAFNYGLVVDATGHVGVDVSTPNTQYALDVHGNINVSGNINAKWGQDVAEWVPASAKLTVGTVVVVSGTSANTVTASTKPYDTRVAGVVSSQPGLLLGAESSTTAKIATTGRVKVRVDATKHPIRMGDLLVTSGKCGMAMRSEPVEVGGIRLHRPGTLIGKALEPLPRGEGEILVLLSLQ